MKLITVFFQAVFLALWMHSISFAQQIQVVNMIPNSLNDETGQNSEPSIAVNPFFPDSIAASAFTFGWNNVCAQVPQARAPIFISVDGGQTWDLNCIVPSSISTRDISLSFDRHNNLFAAILSNPGNLNLNILKTERYTSNQMMAVLHNQAQIDQPYIEAEVANSNRVYVGLNDLSSKRSAAIDTCSDGNAAAPVFALAPIEFRSTAGQDGPSIRPAIHFNGAVYAAYFRYTSFQTIVANQQYSITADLILVRDDHSGLSGFKSLKDTDGQPGKKIVKDITIPWRNMPFLGQERIGSSLSLAVDPRPGKSAIVYVAWADSIGNGSDYTIHVRRTTDAGDTWTADLLTIPDAIAPALAINKNGVVGFLYQQLENQGGQDRWVTHLQVTSNGFEAGHTADLIFSDTPANNPREDGSPYLGDYAGLQAVGGRFYGVFSASNVPDLNNFPSGVNYQRNANFANNTLLDAMNNPVNVSIDPFFFRVDEIDGQDIAVNPERLEFSDVEVGDVVVRTIEISNNGTAALNVEKIGFQYYNPQGSAFGLNLNGTSTPCGEAPFGLAPGASCSFIVTYHPDAPGTESATIQATSNDLDQPIAEIKLNGTAFTLETDISVPRLIDFYTVEVGSASTKTLPIKNTGSDILRINSMYWTQPFGVFSFDRGDCEEEPFELMPGESCTPTITFRPGGPLNYEATLSIFSSDSHSPEVAIRVKGQGRGNEPPSGDPSIQLSPTQLNFGEVRVGEKSRAKTVTVTNSGTGAARTIYLTTPLPVFDVVSEGVPSTTCRGSLEAGERCTIAIVFSPRQLGLVTGELIFGSNDPNRPEIRVSLRGVGVN